MKAYNAHLKMFKLFPPFANLWFIANHALSSVAFIYFLNWYDTGRWESDGWIFMAVSGVLCGTLALAIERWLYRKYNLSLNNRFLFFVRIIAFSILFLALSFALGYAGSYLIDLIVPSSNSDKTLAELLIIPLIAIFYLPMIIPFGIVLGIVNGALFHFFHMPRISNKPA